MINRVPEGRLPATIHESVAAVLGDLTSLVA